MEIGQLDRNLAAGLVLDRLGAKASAWNAAEVRGGVEKLIAEVGIIAEPQVRRELAEDLAARAVARCEPLLSRTDVPEHVRALTSRRVLDVEADLNSRLADRAASQATPGLLTVVPGRGMAPRGEQLDRAQCRVASALVGTSRLLVVEGAAGAGKTKTLAYAAMQLELQGARLVVVTPTRKAAGVAAAEVGGAASSAAWLIRQHGYRWDEAGHWGRVPTGRPSAEPVDEQARLRAGDLLLIDEAGMLDQDTARALLTIADETGVRVALVGDRHQLPAVGRGGALDLAVRWVGADTHLTLDVVHRFIDPDYAALSLKMRTGSDQDGVFDRLLARGEIVIHPTEVERTDALAGLGASHDAPLLVADTREQVKALNAAIRDRRLDRATESPPVVMLTASGERISVGDRIATRLNDRDLDVSNRDVWTVSAVGTDGRIVACGRGSERILPADYVSNHVELAYATTAYGAQGETVGAAHVVIGEGTRAAAAYVGMTRGRERNVAHLVAEDVGDAKRQWIEGIQP